MEKKGSRSVLQPQPSKNAVAESKKSQDGTTAKFWPRGGRRREPSGGNHSIKNEAFRKPNPQVRNKIIYKQPRPRGGYINPHNVYGTEEAELTEWQDPELGSVFVQGSKKQSLNHLLNFHYAPREAHAHYGKSGGSRWNATSKHKYNKEHFLQANCQFVVKASGNYKQYMNNPDALVDWDMVEQVNIQVNDVPSCPICLYPPVAAKMTRCGHVFCWSCVLHYLALTDKTWRKCPICYEAVHKVDLKSVVSKPHAAFNLNETITFKLMKKLRGSLVAYPIDYEEENTEKPFTVSDVKDGIYCKLLLADQGDVLNIIEREKQELRNAIQEDEDSPEKCFIEQAVDLLGEREKFVFTQIHSNKDANCNMKRDNFVTFESKNLDLDSKKFLQNDEGLINPPDDLTQYQHSVDDALKELHIENDLVNKTVNFTTQQAKYFYFYQASDGQHIYLHPINAKMLEDSYGSLEFAPKTITGRIVEKEGGSMTEDIRKRFRYLQHLPITCQFEMVEIKFDRNDLKKDTWEKFQDQLEQRRKRRQRRARDEKRREKRISEEENLKIGKYPTADIHIESHEQFPDFNSDLFFSSLRDSDNNQPSDEGQGPSVPSSIESEYAGPSFAKMLSSTKKREQPPIKTRTETVETLKLINVTGGRSTTSLFNKKIEKSDSEPECEDYVPVPSFNRSFSDAIALALEKAASFNDKEDCKGQGGKKKRKKNKKTVLFTTGMSFSEN